jgi:hypothetical protein
MSITWGTDGVFATIGKAVKETNANSVSESGMLSAAKSFVTAYLSYNFRYLAEITYQSFDDIFWYGLVAKMIEDAQQVESNAVASGAITFEGTATSHIHDASGADDLVTPTQMLLDDDVIRLTCTRASAGADTWQVDSMRRGRISGSATTGVLYGEALTADDKCGLSFTIQAPSAGAYAVDDYFLIGPAVVDSKGKFQTFFRDNFSKTLPASGAPTILDDLADQAGVS